ncbi:predicted protein [Plenodomus lingam JN3]|uniref:Predicted protein n=1 Tax=Leptosphaeria maculans (strain JN3 / isolate v23.1.3 / race Av1-4-5-6-7-8) TaxID=985895 RepID=E5A1W4_LEPMJ|nr:predicted protein [Plenodomus lingam JN3]CBX97681.1 predicted protein [Plenodomus lingam JN3]
MQHTLFKPNTHNSHSPTHGPKSHKLQLASLLTSILHHILAPTDYLPCTTSALSTRHSHPAYNPPPEQKHTVLVDDEFVLVDEERGLDGGPICREGVIAGWWGREG